MTNNMPVFQIFSIFFLLILTSSRFETEAHVLPRCPPSRGGLAGRNNYINEKCVVDKDAPEDWELHFPSGDKTNRPGAALESQIQEANGRLWQPFKPMDPDYFWRYGVCGDMKSDPERLRGGEYYYGAKIVKTYRQGEIIDFELSVIAYHMGFLLFHLCDMSKCDGEISEECFRVPGACQLLEREATPICEENESDKCSPIDRNHPERWYLPCEQKPGDEVEFFGPGTIRYKLPKGVSGDHFVLHFNYIAANTCYPEDLVEYFTGPDKPLGMGRCKNDHDEPFGVRTWKSPCGADTRQQSYPEEYAHCIDIAIEGTGRESETSEDSDTTPEDPVNPTPSPTASTSMESTPSVSADPSMDATPSPSADVSMDPIPSPSADASMIPTVTPSPSIVAAEDSDEPVRIRKIYLVVDGIETKTLKESTKGIKLKDGANVTIKVETSGPVDKVQFIENKKKIYEATEEPFYISESKDPMTWDKIMDYLGGAGLRLEITAMSSSTGVMDSKEIKLWVDSK